MTTYQSIGATSYELKFAREALHDMRRAPHTLAEIQEAEARHSVALDAHSRACREAMSRNGSAR